MNKEKALVGAFSEHYEISQSPVDNNIKSMFNQIVVCAGGLCGHRQPQELRVDGPELHGHHPRGRHPLRRLREDPPLPVGLLCRPGIINKCHFSNISTNCEDDVPNIALRQSRLNQDPISFMLHHIHNLSIMVF